MWATIDNPPVNLMTRGLFAQLAKFSAEVSTDESVRAVVLQSDNPDFFIAHFDVEAIIDYDADGEADRPSSIGGFNRMCEAFRTMPKATICKIAGRVGGGGSELALSCDMRFGARGRAVVNQMEVPIGILPGGGGTQRLPRLVGFGRALEMILGGVDVDAATGERWGYFNRIFDPGDLDREVDALARRIASFEPSAVRRAKEAALASLVDLQSGLIEEGFLMQQLLREPTAGSRMRQFLALGGQTVEGELRVAELVAELGLEND
jgi:enoyl-CoA hydratase/carnithine racemase